MPRPLRILLGIIVGYAIIAAGLSLIVMTWWINEWLPLGITAYAAIALGLAGLGWVAGLLAAKIAGESARPALFGVAALTALVMTVNIVLDVAAEPLWFKALTLALVLPTVLISGSRQTSGPNGEGPDDPSAA